MGRGRSQEESSVRLIALLALLIVVSAWSPSVGAQDGATIDVPDRDQLQSAEVNRVVDGDTVHVDLDGTDETIRLIGIDTPETVDPRAPVACYGRAASVFTKRVLRSGTPVWLEKDISSTDRYARLLRYVWIAFDPNDDRFDGLDSAADFQDGELISFNLLLVAEGYAASSPYAPDVKHQDAFDAAETDAREGGRGLWGECSAFGVPANGTTAETGPATDQPTTTEAPISAGGGRCDPSYPDVCIPPISVAGDLDCGDVSERRFRVVPPDPHGFDANGDGVGCEG